MSPRALLIIGAAGLPLWLSGCASQGELAQNLRQFEQKASHNLLANAQPECAKRGIRFDTQSFHQAGNRAMPDKRTTAAYRELIQLYRIKPTGLAPCDIYLFQRKLAGANTLMQESSGQLVKALASRDQQAEFDQRLKALAGVTDPKEKNALMAQIQADQATQIQQLAANTSIQQQLRDASASKQRAVMRSAGNFALAAVQIAAVIDTGQSVAQGIRQNPQYLLMSRPVLEALPALTDTAASSGKVMASLLDLFKGANLKPTLPDSATAEPQDVTDFGAPFVLPDTPVTSVANVSNQIAPAAAATPVAAPQTPAATTPPRRAGKAKKGNKGAAPGKVRAKP
jgi:hypothetical protein